ncbi:MAG: translation initiation factor IF-2 [Rhodospirillaceae bacterium]|jgi:translation initiation factor IF-2|nr:translation initiation factor IF-2 [Rhodospirillaceae bacterium]
MTDTTERERKRPLKLADRGKLELKKTVDAGQVRQSFSHGRSKAVAVEVKRKRTISAPKRGGAGDQGGAGRAGVRELTKAERDARVRALRGAITGEDERSETREEHESALRARDEAQRVYEAELARQAEEAERAESDRRAEEEKRREAEELRRQTEETRRNEDETRRTRDEELRKRVAERTAARQGDRDVALQAPEPEEEERSARRGKPGAKRTAPPPAPSPRRNEPRRRVSKLTVSAALTGEAEEERTRSVAAMRRARERERLRAREAAAQDRPTKVIRDVVIPETITVQELANRMAERGTDVIKKLMALGVMVTINQTIDADTAELVTNEFGHRMRRISEADVEIGLEGEVDDESLLKPRPPVVTIMGHVDHGKTSLLDALRETDVAGREAGGITQHIGAYQIVLAGDHRITFIDTPGHEAFTAMRARGAQATDLVVLVVAADDGVQPQTVEAINHARAANVPMLVAINKCDMPGADPDRVRNELLSHEIVTEQMGGDTLAIEVSALKKENLDKLEEAILLQAELLELKANPDREAMGVVVESKIETGRGPVATVLIQRGTLRVGDIFVAGAEWGRVRALLNDRGQPIDEAGPATPVEVFGMQGSPEAGDDFSVVENEARAREVSDFRQRRARDVRVALGQRATVDDMFSAIGEEQVETVAVIIKADVQGSAEAIKASLDRLATEEVAVAVLHAGVGGINESDVTLAKASDALIVGFNVRANPQAREIANRDQVDIRYFSIIYEVVDELKAMLSGLLSPSRREVFLGYAEIRKVFNITKVGQVGGCMITEGLVKRGNGVRVLRDDVVVHEGKLSSLKRFKDEVREVREGYECGMAFENFHDLKEGDRVECFEIVEEARTL